MRLKEPLYGVRVGGMHFVYHFSLAVTMIYVVTRVEDSGRLQLPDGCPDNDNYVYDYGDHDDEAKGITHEDSDNHGDSDHKDEDDDYHDEDDDDNKKDDDDDEHL